MMADNSGSFEWDKHLYCQDP